MTTQVMSEMLELYVNALRLEEMSDVSIQKYCRDIRFFIRKYEYKPEIEKDDIIHYKAELIARYKANTANSYLISLNRYLSWLGYPHLTAKTIRLQRKSNLENVISQLEYSAMLQYCLSKGKSRDYLLLRTLAGTGIRVSELKFITREAALTGSAEIYNKGKCRVILLSQELSQRILTYCTKQDIQKGIVFRGRDISETMHPKSIWKLLKRIARGAGVDERKVYPHNLRHLFAKTYMQRIGNVLELADILGHSSIETTRIYAGSSQEEKRGKLSELGL